MFIEILSVEILLGEIVRRQEGSYGRIANGVGSLPASGSK